MSTTLAWSNTLAYSLQIGLMVGLGALAPTLLRIRMPRARLMYWQVLLVACLALPWIRSWRQEVVGGAIQVSTTITAVAPVSSSPAHVAIPVAAVALWILAAGIFIRLILLVTGFVRLSVYRGRGEELPRELRPPGSLVSAQMLVSGDVTGPVTFGWREPVILLPGNFPALAPEMRDAILCHELLHVERRDWLFTIGEELVRAVLWFHPAIWWVLGEIQLAREQTVDQIVVDTTRARGSYVDTLLLMASASGAVEMAPAPMFLRRRHLKKRLMEVVKEVSMSTMSKTRWVCLMGGAFMMMAAACWLATGAFPLMAAPQVVNDGPGVAVNTNGSSLMHRSSVPYPADASSKGIEGMVVVQLKLNANGEVSDAMILSGPDELRKTVLQSVLDWHFDKTEALTTRTVNISFARPSGARPAMPAIASRSGVSAVGASGGLARAFTTGRIDRVVVSGLSDSARDELLSKLPVHAGDDWSAQALASVTKAAKDFDSHLTTMLARTTGGGFEIHVTLPGAAPVFTAAGRGVGIGQGGGVGQGFGSGGPAPVFTAQAQDDVFSVGNGTAPPAVLSKTDPIYTEEARQAKYSGSVMLSVVVNTEGKAEDIKVVRSLGMGLDEKAVECVQQWRFRPGANRGVPVKVRAQIEVNFRLL